MHEGQTLAGVLRGYAPPEACDPIARYVRPNEETAFGKAHGFREVGTYEEFVEAVPLQDYASHEPWIARAADGEGGVLTSEEPVGFEITSGTSNATKRIPVTPAFQQELAMALSVWMGGWERRNPGVFQGPTYWSLSPRLAGGRRTRSGRVIGFDDDGAYFPEDVRAALARWLVVPDGLEADRLFESTAKALRATPELRAVSVWSPVFFLKLDGVLGKQRTWKEIWPELRIVSCWADAQAAMWRDRVIERLGDGVRFEPKGLLATEGVTTIPTEKGAALAHGVHFHEFIDRETGDVGTALEPGRLYEVVLTTGAGLYRYRTGDVIEADEEGRVRFVGRSGDGSDLVGEKLDGEQVARAFEGAAASGFVRVPNGELRYEIWSTAGGEEVLRNLRCNAHFAKALDTGQLGCCSHRPLPSDWESAAAAFLATQRGGREGDVKLPILERGELRELWDT